MKNLIALAKSNGICRELRVRGHRRRGAFRDGVFFHLAGMEMTDVLY